MRKECFFFITLFSIFCFGCQQSEISSEPPLRTTCFVETKDISTIENKFDNSPNFSMQDGFAQARVASGTGKNGITNWILNGWNYKRLDVTNGFEIDLYCNENARFAGAEWYNCSGKDGRSGYDLYLFSVYSDGTFKIELNLYREQKSNWTTILSLPPEKSGINTSKYSRVKVITYDLGDTDVFLNGHRVYTFKEGTLQIVPGSGFAIAFSTIKGETYSETHYAECRYRFINAFLPKKIEN